MLKIAVIIIFTYTLNVLSQSFVRKCFKFASLFFHNVFPYTGMSNRNSIDRDKAGQTFFFTKIVYNFY